MRTRGKLLTGVAKAAATAIVLALLLSRVKPGDIVNVWGEIRTGWAAAALLLVAANLACQFGRLRVGLTRAHPAAGRVSTLRALMVGLAIGAVTPGRLGELGGAAVLPRGGRRRALGMLAVMRGYGFLTTVALGLFMWAWMPELVGWPRQTSRALATAALCGVALLAGATELILRRSHKPWMKRITARFKSAEDVFIGMDTLRASDRALFALWSLLLSAVYLSQLVFLVRAFGGEVRWMDGVAAGSIGSGIVALLPITAGGIGIRESATILVWRHLGISAPIAFNAAFALFLMNVVVPGAVGLIGNAVSPKARVPEPTP